MTTHPPYDPERFPDSLWLEGTSGAPLTLHELERAHMTMSLAGDTPRLWVVAAAQRDQLRINGLTIGPHPGGPPIDGPWVLFGCPVLVDDRVPVINGGRDYCGGLVGKHGLTVGLAGCVADPDRVFVFTDPDSFSLEAIGRKMAADEQEGTPE